MKETLLHLLILPFLVGLGWARGETSVQQGLVWLLGWFVCTSSIGIAFYYLLK